MNNRMDTKILQLGRRLVLPGLWLVCFSTLVAINHEGSLQTLDKRLTAIAEFPREKDKNAMGEVRYVKYAGGGSGKPAYSVHFSDLKATGRQIGIFRTPAVKEVKVSDLDITVFRDSAGDTREPDFAGLLAGGLSKSDDGQSGYSNREKIKWSSDIDMSNVVKMEASNFRYCVIENDRMALEVRGKRAEVQPDGPVIILWGYGIVKNAGGKTLESNKIRWEPASETFSVDGAYVLKTGGRIQTGKSIRVDYKLNPIKETKNAKESEEVQKCYAMQ